MVLNESSQEEDWEDEEAAEGRETAAEKRLRLAKRFITDVREQVALGVDEFDAEDVDRDHIAERLEEDALESLGRLRKSIALTLHLPGAPEVRVRGHDLSVTAVAIGAGGKVMYTGSKDGSIIKWEVGTGKKLHTFAGGRKGVAKFKGHTGHVLALAMSDDGRYLASGGSDKMIQIWSVKDDVNLGQFTQHKDGITGLVFRRGTHDLYSCARDRSVKLWSVEQMAYMETLFGHQDEALAIDALMRERCVTVGGRDRTVRMWKIAQESQLVFRAGSAKGEWAEGSVDVVRMLDEEHFISGSDAGSLSLWSLERKKPIFTIPQAHGLEEAAEGGNPRWITSICTVPYTDVFFSGSWDGQIRAWQVTKGAKGIVALGTIPVEGFVNAMSVAEAGEGEWTLVAGAGQEHRLGRWWNRKGPRNAGYVMRLRQEKAAERAVLDIVEAVDLEEETSEEEED